MSDNEVLEFVHNAQANLFLNIVVPLDDAMNAQWRHVANGIGDCAVSYFEAKFPHAAPDEIKGGPR